MAQATAEIHLKRAYGFAKEVREATSEFRRRAIEHDSQVASNQPFLQGMVSTIRGGKQLAQQKSSLVTDLQLAEREIDQAAALDHNAAIDTDEGSLGALQLRAMLAFMSGQIEMIWGTGEKAKQLFNSALGITEFSDPHYMLGLLYESEGNPAEALSHFEKCLELDPGGELSVPALREANAMRNYKNKKQFRGSWGLFIVLFIFFFPLAIVYFFVKRK